VKPLVGVGRSLLDGVLGNSHIHNDHCPLYLPFVCREIGNAGVQMALQMSRCGDGKAEHGPTCVTWHHSGPRVARLHAHTASSSMFLARVKTVLSLLRRQMLTVSYPWRVFVSELVA
jgi:hypothetical protein